MTMTVYKIIAQAIGIIAMAFNILSYQQKSAKGAITFQLFGCALFAVNFFMLDAVVGSIMNLIGACRAVIFMKKDAFRANHIGWLIGFTAVYVGSYVLTFTVFGTPFTLRNALLELLPIIGMTVSTISFRTGSAKLIRRFGLVCSPAWLVYNVANHALGAIVCEVISLCSIVVGMWRYDMREDKEEAA